VPTAGLCAAAVPPSSSKKTTAKRPSGVCVFKVLEILIKNYESIAKDNHI
jgi:hypothetical protein